jgi:hypothetical protein
MKSDNISFIKVGEEDTVLINLTNLIYLCHGQLLHLCKEFLLYFLHNKSSQISYYFYYCIFMSTWINFLKFFYKFIMGTIFNYLL